MKNTYFSDFMDYFRMRTLFSVPFSKNKINEENRKVSKIRLNRLIVFIFFVFVLFLMKSTVLATEIPDVASPSVPSVNPIIDINFSGQNPTGTTDPTLQLLLLITIITIAPTILIMLTSFTRIIICLHFIRAALGTQQMPPNQILIGLALFLTFFIMGPTFSEINQTAIQPYSQGTMTTTEAMNTAMVPIREFMMGQAETKDVQLFASLDGGTYETVDDVPNRVIIPAFILGEITKGFIFGFIVYVPFIVIDMVVASVLMAMGMMMLPPAMISLPFKIMFFVLVDGWSLMLGNIVESFMRTSG